MWEKENGDVYHETNRPHRHLVAKMMMMNWVGDADVVVVVADHLHQAKVAKAPSREELGSEDQNKISYHSHMNM